MKSDWKVFFTDGNAEYSSGMRIDEVAAAYAPAERRKIIAIISAEATPNCLPIESDLAFIAIKTRVLKQSPPARPNQRGKRP